MPRGLTEIGNWKHVYGPTKGIRTNVPSTLLDPRGSPNAKGVILKDGDVKSDFGHTDYPVVAAAKTNELHGSIMRIDQFYLLSGLSHLYAFTTTNAYEYNTSTETWDNVTQGATVEDCEDVWTDNTNSTSAVDGTTKLRGTNALKVTIDAAFGTGVASYEDFASTDFSSYTALHFWIRSDIATAAGDLQILLDDTSGCVSALETLAVPALTADTWTAVCIDIVTPGNLTAVISVGLNIAVDNGAQVVHLDDIKAVKRFTGDEDNRFSATTMNDTFIVTNGVDQPQKSTGGNFSDLTTTLNTGSITTSEVVMSFKDHIIFMNNTENAADAPQRVTWSNIGAAEDFTNGTSGYQDLVDDASWIVGAELMSENEVVIYKERSIVKMIWVGGHTPFRFRTMVYGSGAVSKEGITSMGRGHAVIGPDVIYEYKGGNNIEVLDDDVKKTLFSRIDGEFANRSFLLYVEEDDELQVWIPTGTAYPDEVWTMNIVDESWYIKDRAMTGFGFYQRQSSFTIGDLVGNIGDQDWRFGDALTKDYSPITLVGDSNGKVYELNKTTFNNDGTAITNVFESPDFTLPDTPEYMNRFMRVGKLIYEAFGQSITTYWSGDGGLTWSPTQGSATNKQSLDSVAQIYEQDFDAFIRKIRFKFENTDAGSSFNLRYYGFYWMVRSGRR